MNEFNDLEYSLKFGLEKLGYGCFLHIHHQNYHDLGFL